MFESTSSCSAVSLPSLSAPALTVTRIGCRVEVAMNCSSRVSSNFTGRPVLSAASARMSSTNISCLPPKPPPTRSQNTRTLSAGRLKQVGQRAPCQERHLRAGADIEDSVGIDPGKAAMGLQRGMLHPLRRERTLIGDGGLRQRAATSPNSPWISATILRLAFATRFSASCRRAARGRQVRSRRQDRSPPAGFHTEP